MGRPTTSGVFQPALHKNLLLVLVILIAQTLTVLPQRNPKQQGSNNEGIVAIEDVSIVDCYSPAVQRSKTVVIVGNRIHAIGDTGKVSVPSNARRVKGTGKYLIPGLWDSHVHLSSGEDSLPLFVANGVTTVREMGGDLMQVKSLRDRVVAREVIGPRIKIAGTIIESERWMTWAAEGAKKDNDTEFLATLSQRIGVRTPEHAVEVIKNLAEQGIDLVKVRNTHSADTFKALVAEAKKHNLPVAAHAPRMNLIEASDSGLKSIEHVDTVASLRREVSVEELAKAFFRNGTLYTPTLLIQVIWRLTPTEQLADLLSDVDGKKNPQNLYVRPSTIQRWKRDFNMQKNEGTFDWAAQTRKGIEEFRTMHKGGAQILAGTDFGAPLIYAGFSLHDELEALVNQGGLRPYEALQTATKNPPYFFGMQDQIGTIEVGKIADLVLLNDDPIKSISNTRKIHSVILDGKLHSRTDLEKLLKTARSKRTD